MSKMKKDDAAFQKCINPDCAVEFDCGQTLFKCPKCGELLDIQYDWDKISVPDKMSDFAKRWKNRDNRLDFSGVWRFRELLSFCDDEYKVSIGEGQTLLQQNDGVAGYVNVKPGRLYLQYEGLNPSARSRTTVWLRHSAMQSWLVQLPVPAH